MKIAIAGYGLEGKTNYEYWSAQPGTEVVIVDEREVPASDLPQGARTDFGEGVFTRLHDYDLVVRTPGLSPYRITTNGKLWSGTREFFAHCPAPIIGVTGSKGKGTVASLITSILEADGKKVWLVGNIGKSALEVLSQIQPTDYVVYELSSFQLWDLEQSPQTAVVLLIEPEHLDVHKDMDDYVNAKANIARHQRETDRLIYLAENEYTEYIAALAVAQNTPFPGEKTAHISDNDFYYGEQKLCSKHVLNLKGKHNKLNAIAAIDAVWPLLSDASSVERGIAAFHGLPHRLAFVATVNGVDYYDDSIATTPGSAIAALRAFDQQKVIILGGSSKKVSFDELAQELTKHTVTALLIGDEASHIAAACDAAGFVNYEIIAHPTMESVVRRAAERAPRGSVVLLSPAAASFGLFSDYIDRGDQFIAAVAALPEHQ